MKAAPLTVTGQSGLLIHLETRPRTRSTAELRSKWLCQWTHCRWYERGNCGILRRDNAGRIGQAWALGRSSADKPSGVASTLFRRAYSHEPRIHFIGIWDPQFAETASPAARPGLRAAHRAHRAIRPRRPF